MYPSALIELGLVLFGITIVMNGAARLADSGDRRERSQPMKLSFRRKAVNTVMLALTGVCTALAVGLLFFILGYLFVQGGFSLSWNFFTKLPVPVGEMGGGMANALVGSAKVLLLATCIGVPIGFLAGVYLAEYAGGAYAAVIRFVTDLLNGVPSIVIGIFVYTLIVAREGFSTYSGGIALGIMMIPIALRSTEEFLHSVPGALREGAMALGATKSRDHRDRSGSGGHARADFGNDAQSRACRGRDRSAAVYRVRQPVLEPGLGAADSHAPGDDLQLCRGAIPGLAPPGLGSRIRAAHHGAVDQHHRPVHCRQRKFA